MITLENIKKAIVDKLKSTFSIPVISQDVEKGFRRPSLTVNFEDVRVEELESQFETYLLVRIYYFSKLLEINASVDILDMQLKLPLAFGNHLKVADRAIHISDVESNVVDGILVHEFSLLFEQEKEDLEDAEYMQTLHYESE